MLFLACLWRGYPGWSAWIMDVRKGARLFVYTLAKILPSLFNSDRGLYEVYDFTASLEKIVIAAFRTDRRNHLEGYL